MPLNLKQQIANWRTEPALSSALWLPSQSFVYKCLDFGPTVTGDDLLSAITLQIEEDSPLPLEQIAWGFYQANATGPVLLYMSHRGLAFKTENTHETDRPTYPSLLCALHEVPKQDTIQLVLSDTELSAVHQNAGNPIPFKVDSVVLNQPISSALPESLPEHLETIREAETRLKQHIPTSAHANLAPSILAIRDSKVLSNENIEVSTYQITPEGTPTLDEPVVLLDSAQFYQCDLRDKPFLNQKKKQAQQAEHLLSAFNVGIYAFAALILLQLLLSLGSTWLQSQARKVAARSLAVERVNQKEQLLNSIELFSITAFQPFEALDQMNQMRPDTLYFDNMQAGTEGIKANEQFFIQLRGIASSAAEADRFAKNLQDEPNFFKVTISDIRSQSRQTDFKLFVQLTGDTNYATTEIGTE